MGHRLSAITTRTGDSGSTGLGDGARVSKSDLRVAAMGDVDELSCAVGLLLAFGVPPGLEVAEKLAEVQQDLLDLGGELSIPGHSLLPTARVAALESWLSSLNANLPRLQEFVRPGGSVQAAQSHMCRTICRRAERSLVLLAESQTINQVSLHYLNRLSDLLFVIARVINQFEGTIEPQWDRGRSQMQQTADE